MKKKIYITFFTYLLSLGLISAFPIKFVEDNDDGEMLRNMFKGIRSMITDLQNSGIHHDNETKPHDPNIESAESFAFPRDKMRKLIEKKMEGAENATAAKISAENENMLKDENKHIEREGEDVVKKDEIGCTDKEDCNKTSYCNRLSYTCETCHKDGGKCMNQDECCSGYTCDEDKNICNKKKGKAGQACTSKAECAQDFCCALNDNGDGVCQAYLMEGEECGNDPFTTFFASQSLFVRDVMTGLPNKCPCHHHLKCEKQRSLIFMESQVCSKKDEKKSDHKAFIKITFKSSPVLKFHSEGDMDDLPLPSFFPKESTSLSKELKAFRKPPHHMHTRGFTMRFSTRKDKEKKSNNVSLRKSPFSFFHFSNPFDEQEVDDIKAEMKSKRNLKRERRKLVDNVGEEARESVHRAVDGIFDTIMKKISLGEKYRE